jgi:hypothetical protein
LHLLFRDWRVVVGMTNPHIVSAGSNEDMPDTRTGVTAEVTAQLEALAADLSKRGFTATIAMGGRYPRLMVVNKAASRLSEDIYAAPTSDDGWWFWWSWAERIAPIGDVDSAAFKIAHVLTPNGR